MVCIYANGSEDAASENKESAATIDGHTLFFALQCRVRPSAIVRPDRHFARNIYIYTMMLYIDHDTIYKP